jgi:hypothetical protein
VAKDSRTIYVCPGESCAFLSMMPGKCRSHPYRGLRALGPELVPLDVVPMDVVPMENLQGREMVDVVARALADRIAGDGDPLASMLTDQAEDVLEAIAKHFKPTTPGVCRECGCTPERACWHEDFGGCGWAEPDLCTACTPDSGEGWERPALSGEQR